jgi:two-component system sensor histidine kinase KdpD
VHRGSSASARGPARCFRQGRSPGAPMNDDHRPQVSYTRWRQSISILYAPSAIFVGQRKGESMLTESRNQGPDDRRSNATRTGLIKGETIEQRRVTAALLDSIARDIVRPVLLIAGAAAGLRNSRSANEDARERLAGVIEKETGFLEKSLYLLLDMAKLESDGFELCAENVSITALVRATARDCRDELGNRKLEVNLPTQALTARLDPTVLRRVVRILLENAGAQSPPQSIVTVQAARDLDSVRLQVMDEGEGFSQLTDHVFKQFYPPSNHGSPNTIGGMGLAVCRGYVEAMGGTITAANRTDRSGTVFTLTFPVESDSRGGARQLRS